MADNGRIDIGDKLCPIEQDAMPDIVKDVKREELDSVVLRVQFNPRPLEQSVPINRAKYVLEFIHQFVAELENTTRIKIEIGEFSERKLTYLQEQENIDFERWLHAKQDLVALLRECSTKVVRNFTIGNWFRIIVSTADVFSNFASALLPISSLCSHIIELDLLKEIIVDVKRAMKRDKECFQDMKKWFEYTVEVDESKNIFPYCINYAAILITEESFGHLDEGYRIFFAIIISNGMNDPALLKDRNFLRKAVIFSKSAVEKRRLRRYLQPNIHSNWKCYFSQMSFLDNSELGILIDICKISPTRDHNIIFNFFAITLAGLNLFYNSNPSFWLQSEAARAEEELEEIRKSFSLLLTTME